jgi:hypothetical protein
VPDLSFGAGVASRDDEELAEKIARHEELKPFAKEYGSLDDDLKEVFTEPGDTVVGEWLVTAKPSSTTVYDVPKEIKAPYARKVPFVRRSYVPILLEAAAEASQEAGTEAPPAPLFVDPEPRPVPEALQVPPTVLQPSPASPAVAAGGFDL